MPGAPRRVAILGSTGSIGESGLAVCRAAPERFVVAALAAATSAQALAAQARRVRPEALALVDASAHDALLAALAAPADANGPPWRGRIHVGRDAVVALIRDVDVDVHLIGITGAASLPATFAAAATGSVLALANKESVVMAGPLLGAAVAAGGGTLVPVDSEHSALFQALAGNRRVDVQRLILTSSGGPFRDLPRERFASVTTAQALNHPRWQMGAKISIDSATMMNKALEIIEARWLFDIDADRIAVLIHPEAIIHSLVEYVDGSVVAQLGLPDMRVPIRHALGYPERVSATGEARLDLAALGTLTFHAPDPERFPALVLGDRAARAGGTMGAVLNAANEEAVDAFRDGRLRFDWIPTLVAQIMDQHVLVADPDLAAILAADAWARSCARALLVGAPPAAGGTASPALSMTPAIGQP